MKKRAMYPYIILILVLFLAVGLVGSVTELAVTRLSDSSKFDQYTDWKSDSKSVFESKRTGSQEIWGINADGSNLKLVTDETERGWAPAQQTQILVITNSIDFELATEFFRFLRGTGMKTDRTTASNFEQNKEGKFIVILGGPDAPEGVGELVQMVLSKDEQNSIREKGARKKYVTPDVWTQGQRVMVIAGYNRNETKNSVNENKDSIVPETMGYI